MSVVVGLVQEQPNLLPASQHPFEPEEDEQLLEAAQGAVASVDCRAQAYRREAMQQPRHRQRHRHTHTHTHTDRQTDRHTHTHTHTQHGGQQRTVGQGQEGGFIGDICSHAQVCFLSLLRAWWGKVVQVWCEYGGDVLQPSPR